MTLPLLPTSLVGSYAQPEWLIDRKKLADVAFLSAERREKLESIVHPAGRHDKASAADRAPRGGCRCRQRKLRDRPICLLRD